MGNLMSIVPFTERKIQGLDEYEHLNKFLNKYMKYQSESNQMTWDQMLQSIDLDSSCFTKLKQMDQVLCGLILDLAINLCNKTTVGITPIVYHQHDSIKILEYWYETKILYSLEYLYNNNKYPELELDFSSISCSTCKNYLTIGSNVPDSNTINIAELIIPYKNNKSVTLRLSPQS